MTIFKYRMPAPGQCEVIQMPKGARIVHVGLQDGLITAWAIVNPDAPMKTVSLATVGTGWNVPEEAEYVGTVFQDQFVWHVLRAS